MNDMFTRRSVLKAAGGTGLFVTGGLASTGTAAAYTIDSSLRQTVNISGSQLDAAINAVSQGSPLIGLGSVWIQIQYRRGINALYMAAHAAHESGWGRSSIAQAKNNLYGFNARDVCPAECADAYASFAQCARQVMAYVDKAYLTPGGTYYEGATLRGMNRNYATDQQWAEKIANLMNDLKAALADGGADDTDFGNGGGGRSYSWKTYKVGDEGKAIYAVHYLLKQHGYGISNQSNTFTNGLKQEVKRFQKDNGLTSDGVVDADTWKKLTVSIKDISIFQLIWKIIRGVFTDEEYDSKHDTYWAVVAVQNLLVAHGYELKTYGIDGSYNDETKAAIKHFQKRAEIGVTGEVNPPTWRALIARE